MLYYIIPMKFPPAAFSIYKQNLNAECAFTLKYCLKFCGTAKTYVDCHANLNSSHVVMRIPALVSNLDLIPGYERVKDANYKQLINSFHERNSYKYSRKNASHRYPSQTDRGQGCVQHRIAIVRRRSAGVSLSPSAHLERYLQLEGQVPGCSTLSHKCWPRDVT
jgi:hypothetical protein